MTMTVLMTSMTAKSAMVKIDDSEADDDDDEGVCIDGVMPTMPEMMALKAIV
jgi:hypothetical protein